jgi:glycosyltransferase involved in cell wall biosynthesis
MSLASTDDSQNPAVTVVMPAYNQERFIEDAVKSIQAQDYRGPISLLIWNDGSTDRTQQILDRLQREDARIVVHSTENRGRPVTRQCLLETAETELIAWLDPDDFASPCWLRQQVSGMQNADSTVACGGQGYAMLSDRDPIGPIPRPLTHDEIHGVHLDGGVAINQTGVLTKRTALIAAGGYRAKYLVGEDYDLWLRLAERGKLMNLPECHVFYRIHEASANWTANEKERALWYEILNQARERRGLAPYPIPESLPLKKQDWNRRIFWINVAAREGNARSCLKLLVPALRKHPTSLLLWMFGIVGVLDTIRFRGNRVPRFEPGVPADFGATASFSFYLVARSVNRLRRKLFTILKLRPAEAT